jgi:hypothetical protein
MQLDLSKIETIASTLLDIAGSFIPGANVAKDALILKQLLGAGGELNSLLTAIKTNPDNAAVWDLIRTDYADSVYAFNASVDAHHPSN